MISSLHDLCWVWGWKFFENRQLSRGSFFLWNTVCIYQSCQPLRFWRNDYAFWALITPLRLSIVELRFTISQLSSIIAIKQPL